MREACVVCVCRPLQRCVVCVCRPLQRCVVCVCLAALRGSRRATQASCLDNSCARPCLWTARRPGACGTEWHERNANSGGARKLATLCNGILWDRSKREEEWDLERTQERDEVIEVFVKGDRCFVRGAQEATTTLNDANSGFNPKKFRILYQKRLPVFNA